jgi:phage tail-like protein
MLKSVKNLYSFDPPVAFYFGVSLSFFGAELPDTSFQEVSGISCKIETEDITEGGNFRSVYHLPKGVKYENLQLKRGLTPVTSAFAMWCMANLMDTGIKKIVTATIRVRLFDSSGDAVCMWIFSSAYPVKWSLDQLNSKKNDLAIESMEISYRNYERLM